jgi:3-oxoacyl-[acyl-carrier-protein] synthase-3
VSSLPAPSLGGIAVAGWGTALPEQRVTNHDLTQRLDTSDEWIVDRTGIRERRVSGAGESTGPLAVEASRAALSCAGMTASDIDLVVVATATPERPIPSTAAEVAAELGTSAGGFDLNAACAGFVYGLTATAGILSAGAASTALLVGADTMTTVIDPDDRGTAILFGDGAAAFVLVSGLAATARSIGSNGSYGSNGSNRATGSKGSSGATGTADGSTGMPASPGLVASDMMHDPDGIELLFIEAGGSRRPATAETVAAGQHYLRMDGREVFRRAVRAVTLSVERTLARAGCGPEDVTLFVPHQANARIVDSVVPRLGISAERTLRTIDRFGNTSAASIPLSLAEVADTGALGPGDLVLMCGFGAGLSVGTALWRWDVVAPATGAATRTTTTSGKDVA